MFSVQNLKVSPKKLETNQFHDMSVWNRIVHSHAWPNYSRYRRGLPSVLPSSMDGLWSGEYVAQEEKVHWPELFLYSKSDFYLPYEHLEQEVLAKRKALGRDYRTVRQVNFYIRP